MKNRFIISLLSVLLLQGYAPQDAMANSWVYTHSTDDFTDEDRSYVFTSGENELTLAFKCMEDGLNVLFLLGRYMGGDSQDRIKVRYRIDQHEPSDRSNWHLLQGQKSAWMPMSMVPWFRAQAEQGKSVVMEALDPLDGESRRSHFSLIGLKSALSQLPCASQR